MSLRTIWRRATKRKVDERAERAAREHPYWGFAKALSQCNVCRHTMSSSMLLQIIKMPNSATSLWHPLVGSYVKAWCPTCNVITEWNRYR